MPDEQAEIRNLSACLLTLPKSVLRTDPEWPNAPLRLIDCVLSLNRRYDQFVYPRVTRFMGVHPDVDTLQKLNTLIFSSGGALKFFIVELDYNDIDRASTFQQVLDYLIKQEANYIGNTDLQKIATWAKSVSPIDWVSANIDGFAIAGWQYLRMLFGVDTV